MTMTTFAPRLAIAAALSSGLMALALLAAGPAAAQTMDEDSFTQQMLGSLGLIPPPAPEIEYRERAPLVVPPSGEVLPPPRDEAAITGNPAWPKDYDVERKKKEEAAAKKVTIFVNDKKARRPLSTAEVEGTRTGIPSNHQAKGRNQAARDSWVQPGGLDFTGWTKKEQQPVAFAGEPERDSLTQPPVGYQTPASDAAYGVVADRPEDKVWKPSDLFDKRKPNERH